MEDVLCSGFFLRLAKRPVFTHHGTYCYNVGPASVMHTGFIERFEKITSDQFEVLYLLGDFYAQTGADAELLRLFDAWKEGLWKYLEFRYQMFRRQLKKGV